MVGDKLPWLLLICGLVLCIFTKWLVELSDYVDAIRLPKPTSTAMMEKSADVRNIG
ncbi:unnamed protein product [Arabidopsis halleri]